MANGILNIQKTSGGITSITVVDGTGNTSLILPESGSVATTAVATETTTGLIELATTAETQAGTDDSRAITPLKLKNSVLGLGQTWQDVTASRVAGTTYTNSTGKPIYISITTTPYSGGWINVGGTIVIRAGSSNSGIGTFYWTVQAIIPNGVTYTYSGSPTVWYELR